MKRRGSSGAIPPWLTALGALAAGLLLAGWVGARTLYPLHLRQVTGRADTPKVACTHCHRHFDSPPRRGAANGNGGPRYISPAGMALSPNGRTLFVAAAGADKLLAVDVARRQVMRSADIPGRPYGVTIATGGKLIAVSSRDRDVVSILDAATLKVRNTIPAGADPIGVAFSPAASQVYVACGGSNDLLIADLASPSSALRLVAGNDPYAVAASRDGRLVVVANRLARPVPARTIPVSEVTLVDAQARRVADRRFLVSAHLSEGVAISSDGAFVLATATRVRNLLPITQVARGALMNAAIVFIETKPGGRTVQFPLSEVNAYFANPSGIALTPDDRVAFVAHGGARTVTAVDTQVLRKLAASRDDAALEAIADDMGASPAYVLARIPTLDNPRNLAISPDGSRLYVAERLADSIAIVDIRKLAVIGRIDLGGPAVLTAERRGERVFNDASTTFQGQFSCRSCHPDGGSDGLVWDFEIDGVGKNLVDTRSLEGIRDTAPYKWNGKNPDLKTQCGPRFARVLTRSDPFRPEQLDDLVAFINSLPLPPGRMDEHLAAARARGQRIFYRTQTNTGKAISVASRCNTCHRPPLFTDRLPSDVGTGGSFDAPHLLGVRFTAPYLHDGRAVTLEEIWTVHNPNDTHGITNDMTKLQLNDLVTYLRSL